MLFLFVLLLHDIIKNQNSKNINITENLKIAGLPIVAGPFYCTSRICEIQHIILHPSLSFIPHILKYFFERLDTTCTEDTLLSLFDIRSLYKSIRHDVFYKAINYWIGKWINEMPLLGKFTKAFILEEFFIVLEFNHLYINNYFCK